MASTNQSPFYRQAEGKFNSAKTTEEKLKWLEEMIRECPKHKSSEKMLANLKTRQIKLREKIESPRKTSKGSKRIGVKKEEMQAVIVGFTNTGKSTLLNLLTNTHPLIGDYEFTTKDPIIGMMPFLGMQIQIIEIPAIESDYFDKSVANSADTIILLISSLDQLEKINKLVERYPGKRIIVFNNFDKSESELRKIDATLKSKKHNYMIINTESNQNIEDLKEKIFQSFNKIRVFTKEPGKPKSNKPIILNPGANVKDVAEKIFHGFSRQIKESFVTGPSSKFPNQKTGLNHILKDMDIVEFRTR
ncbi:50S ribosome-binding GTPase [Candidatus Pacearchaeota archaeon]|nr:50S ribosome-binding GTPase [Candidatus Pacearchaeota archaeon]